MEINCLSQRWLCVWLKKRALFKYDLENDLRIKKSLRFEKTEMFPAALVLVVTKNKTHTLSKLDLENALRAFSKYDLEKAHQ